MGCPGEILALKSCPDWNPCSGMKREQLWPHLRGVPPSPCPCDPKHAHGDAPDLWEQPQWVSQSGFWTRPSSPHFSRATPWCGRAPGRFKPSRLLGAAKSQPKEKGAGRRKDLVGLSKSPQHPAQPAPHLLGQDIPVCPWQGQALISLPRPSWHWSSIKSSAWSHLPHSDKVKIPTRTQILLASFSPLFY